MSFTSLHQKLFSIRKAGAAAALLLALAIPASAALIFEADFNGSGSGTGGASDIVALGGTGVLGNMGYAGTSTATVTNASSMGQGNYLAAVLAPVSGQANVPTVVFTPTSAASSWSALSSTTASGTRISLNGGFDSFVRTSVGGATASNLARLVNASDFASTGLMIDFTNGNGGGLALVLYSPTNAISGDNVTFNRANAYLGTSFNLTADTVTHVGFTYSTDATGKITMSLFARNDDQAIDTTSIADRIATTSFYVDSSVSGGVSLAGTDFNVKMWNGSGVNPSEADVDLYRIYDSAPTLFTAVPEPSAMAYVGIGLVGLVIGLKTRRNLAI